MYLWRSTAWDNFFTIPQGIKLDNVLPVHLKKMGFRKKVQKIFILQHEK